MRKPIALVLDIMADNTSEVVAGATRAASSYSDIERIILVGPMKFLEAAPFFQTKGRLIPLYVSSVVEMDESLESARRKKNSSIMAAFDLLKQGTADILISAGNSVATVFAAKSVLGMIEGVHRPAIAAILPKVSGKTILIDVGAIVDAKPEWIRDWAILGSVYAKLALKIDKPKVGLLNIGVERTKGNRLTKATLPLLEGCPLLNFIGNTEYIFSGEADVIVCDGFVGNTVLKNLEDGIPLFTKGRYKETDYAFYGGALLLGVNGTVVIAHGKSNARAIENAIGLAKEVVKKGIIDKMKEAFRVPR